MPDSVVIWFAGDYLHGAARVAPTTPFFKSLGPGQGYLNLEGPAHGTPGPPRPGSRQLMQAAGALDSLVASGVRWVGIANNHALDHGTRTLDATRAALRNRRLLPIAGRGEVVNIAGLRIGMTGHDLTNAIPDGMSDDFRMARAGSDLWIATFHTTGPESYLPDARLDSAVVLARQEGATLIITHGSHRVARLERTGTAAAVFGLGNAVMDCDCTQTREAIVVRATLTASGLRALEVIPIEAGLQGQALRRAPDAEGIIGLLRALGSTTIVQRDDRWWLE